MKDVYIKNPQMGDPTSVDPRLAEIGQNIEKLQLEAQKFEVSYVSAGSPPPQPPILGSEAMQLDRCLHAQNHERL